MQGRAYCNLLFSIVAGEYAESSCDSYRLPECTSSFGSTS